MAHQTDERMSLATGLCLAGTVGAAMVAAFNGGSEQAGQAIVITGVLLTAPFILRDMAQDGDKLEQRLVEARAARMAATMARRARK